MNLLLDTHVVLWWLGDMPDLRAETRAAIAERSNVVHVSAVTAWEIVVKRALGKLDIPERWEETMAREPFSRLPVTWEHALHVGRLEDIHRDPFDRLLVAQAMVDKLTLVTRDAALSRYGIPVLSA